MHWTRTTAGAVIPLMLAPIVVEGIMADGTRGPITVYVLRPDIAALPPEMDHIDPENFDPDFYDQAATGFEITASGSFSGSPFRFKK